MAGPHLVKFVPNPIQKQFIESRAKADLFSSRMGEGKSVALSWSAFYHTRHNPKAKWAIIRDTWENLQATTMKTFFEWFPPGIMGSWHATNRVFTWASGIAEGEVTFLGMDAPEDASKLMSREFAGFAIDEPAPAVGSVGVDEMIFDIGISRLRQAGMNWYGVKLAENNPDESHWTYKKFVDPGVPGYQLWQPPTPENMANLPPDYYSNMRKALQDRPDLIRRFVDGQFGFQMEGQPVTPQWSDRSHLAIGLHPLPRRDVYCCWDFGLNPSCIITQITPQGYWLILESYVGEGIGVEELVYGVVKPSLNANFRNCPLHHIGDPAGTTREQSSSSRSAVRILKKICGGTWRAGPVKIEDRVLPMQAVLNRMIGGTGMVQVDRYKAKEIWYALRGGWHYHKAATGVTSQTPKKDLHSHPGDAISYGAAVLFPIRKLDAMMQSKYPTPPPANAFGNGGPQQDWRIGPKPAIVLPQHQSQLQVPGKGLYLPTQIGKF